MKRPKTLEKREGFRAARLTFLASFPVPVNISHVDHHILRSPHLSSLSRCLILITFSCFYLSYAQKITQKYIIFVSISLADVNGGDDYDDGDNDNDNESFLTSIILTTFNYRFVSSFNSSFSSKTRHSHFISYFACNKRQF